MIKPWVASATVISVTSVQASRPLRSRDTATATSTPTPPGRCFYVKQGMIVGPVLAAPRRNPWKIRASGAACVFPQMGQAGEEAHPPALGREQGRRQARWARALAYAAPSGLLQRRDSSAVMRIPAVSSLGSGRRQGEPGAYPISPSSRADVPSEQQLFSFGSAGSERSGIGVAAGWATKQASGQIPATARSRSERHPRRMAVAVM
jgi:hypothetical protein